MGWIATTEILIRDLLNEGAVNPKWTSAKILGLVEKSFGLIAPEIFRNADSPNSVRLSVSTTADTLIYVLPPNVAEIIRIAKLNTDGRIEWTVDPRSRWNPAGVGVTLDNNQIRFAPTWRFNETLTIWYIPTGEVSLIEGTLGPEAQTSAVLAFDKSDDITTGTVDTRTNAYAGYVISLLDDSANDAQDDRIITASAFASSTGITSVTVEPVLSFTPQASADTWEIRPVFGDVLQMAVALRVAMFIATAERMDRARSMLKDDYNSVMRELRLRAASKDQMIGGHFRGDTYQNERYSPFLEAGGVTY